MERHQTELPDQNFCGRGCSSGIQATNMLIFLQKNCTIESILSSCITVWGSSCTDHSRKALQRIVNTAGKIIGAPLPLPSLQDIYTTRLTRKATSIANDTSHPAHSLFSFLPSGRRYRSLRCRTTRLRNGFIHQAVRKLNSLPSLPPAISVS